MTVDVHIISAFTKDGTGGNPAAVILDGDRFSDVQKQEIAHKIGLSETAFIGASTIADFKLDFFTPVRRIAHCGHATIASFSHLKKMGRIKGDQSSKETIDGRREIKFIGTEAFMEQTAPQYSFPESEDIENVIHSIGLSKEDIVVQKPVIVNTGNSFLLLELQSEEALQNLTPDFAMIEHISKAYNLIGYYIFYKPAFSQIDASARMFAPAYGIAEEAATGMAAGPLACYLYQFATKKETYLIEQGAFMKPPSASSIKVNLSLHNNQIQSLFAGGNATLIEMTQLQLY